MKKCVRCNIIYDDNNFYTAKKYKNGYKNICIHCDKTYYKSKSTTGINRYQLSIIKSISYGIYNFLYLQMSNTDDIYYAINYNDNTIMIPHFNNMLSTLNNMYSMLVRQYNNGILLSSKPVDIMIGLISILGDDYKQAVDDNAKL